VHTVLLSNIYTSITVILSCGVLWCGVMWCGVSRYETGVIQPPVYAGTFHVSPFRQTDMHGGDFAANMDGLSHYAKHGYKGKLTGSADGVVDELKECLHGGPGNWNIVKYKHNRGIMHDGDFPHLSTPVDSIAADSPAQRRVILGLNCFPASVGECCLRAPEHSQAFNRTVKLYQKLAKLTGDSASASSKYDTNAASDAAQGEASDEARAASAAPKPPAKKGFSINEIKKNPALTKLLLTAAKKVKEVRAKQEAAAVAASDPSGASASSTSST
jgi:hypothetical protein